MVLIMVGSILLTFASLPPAYFGLILVIDVMEYHEWKTGNRVEGVISSVNGFASKVGSGVASVALLLSSMFYIDEEKPALISLMKTMTFYAVEPVDVVETLPVAITPFTAPSTE